MPSLNPSAIHREVTHEEATSKASELNILFMETSAKAGHNVKGLFKKIALSLPGMEKDPASTESTATS
jgi:Ras-related protein Rab-6A